MAHIDAPSEPAGDHFPSDPEKGPKRPVFLCRPCYTEIFGTKPNVPEDFGSCDACYMGTRVFEAKQGT